MGFVELLGCSYPCLVLDLGHFQPLFLHVLISPCLSSPSGDLTVNVLVCFMISHGSIRLVHLHVFFFPFNTPSGLQVSAEKSTNSIIGVPLYVTSHFSLASFKIFSLTFDNLITICLGVTLFGFISSGTLCLPGP